MLLEPTVQQLYKMRLNGMAEAFLKQLEDSAMGQLSFEERFGLLVESQWVWKESRALTRRLSLAKLKQPACMEDINYRHPRQLAVARWKSMAHESAWVRRKLNVIVCGPTGVGKSFLSCALLNQACRDGFSALYTRAPQLFRDLRAARAEGTLPKLLKKLARVDALVVDDFALAPMDEHARREFLDICDDRYLVRSTVLTSQLPVEQWHEPIGDPSVADSILDRMVHVAHRFELRGESLRKVQDRKRVAEAEQSVPTGPGTAGGQSR